MGPTAVVPIRAVAIGPQHAGLSGRFHFIHESHLVIMIWEQHSAMRSMWVLVVALTSGPLAPAAANEFYVVHDIATKQCAVVESPPTTTDVVLVEKGNVYFNRDEANRIVASHTLCCPSSEFLRQMAG